MFLHKKHSPAKLWFTILVLIGLAAVTLIIQAKILFMLEDLSTSIFRVFLPSTFVMDSNPLPPIMPTNLVK